MPYTLNALRMTLGTFLLSLTAACGTSVSHQSQNTTRIAADNPRILPEKISSLVALGDSVMAGYGAPQGSRPVPLFQQYLSQRYDRSVVLQDFSQGGATSQSILNSQLNPAVTFITANADQGVVVIIDAGGNDLLGFLYSAAYQKTCGAGDLAACYTAVVKILERTDQTLDRILSALRSAASSANPILVLTYANARLASGCAAASQKKLFEGSLEGIPGTALNRGLNSRIRDVSAVYGAEVVDVYTLLNTNLDATISKDCIHPNANGYRVIYQGIVDVFERL